MKLSDTYQKIINDVMVDKIEDWNSLSYLDPTKMIVSGLVGSLAQIEERQNRLAGQMLSMTPTLLGVEAKKASGPSILLQFQSQKPAANSLQIPKETRIEFFGRGEEDAAKKCVSLEHNFCLSPVQIKTHSFSIDRQTGTTLTCKFELSGESSRLELFFLPDSPGLLNVGDLCDAVITSGSRTLNYDYLRVQDNTSGLRGAGSILIEIPEERNDTLVAGPLELTLRWEQAASFTPSCKFLVNALKAQLVEVKEWCEIGRIKGDSWEEVRLPNDLVEVPQELNLELPSGGYIKLQRAEDELLRVILQEPEQLKGIYLYNSIRHSVTFPAAHLLVGNYMGGLPVVAKEALFQASAEIDIGDADFKCESIQVDGEIVEIQALALVGSQYKRENEEEVLARFHASLRGVQLQQSTLARRLDLSEIHSAVLVCDLRIRQVEVECQDSLSVFVATETFCDTAGNLTLAGALPVDLKEKLKRVLSYHVPFDISWKVAGFNRVRLDFALKLAYASKVAPTKAVLLRALNSILLPNTLKKNSKQALSANEIFKQLQALVPGVTKVEGTIFNSDTGEYVDLLSRGAGTIFESNIDLVVTKNV